MSSHYNARRYDQARVQAELEGKKAYYGTPCKKSEDHIEEDGTTLRDTIKYGCVQCTREKEQQRNEKRRRQYVRKKERV